MEVHYLAQYYYPATRLGGPMYSMHASANGLAARNVKISVLTTNHDGRSGLFLDVPIDQKVVLAPNYSVQYFRGGKYSKLSYAFVLSLRKRMQSSDMTHLQDVYSSYALLGLVLARLAGKPILISARGVFSPWALASGRSGVKRIWNRFLLKPLTTNSKRIAWHATSEKEKQDIERQFPSSTCHVVPNAMKADLLKFPGVTSQKKYIEQFAPQLARNGKAKILVCLGRLHAIKGYDIAIAAMASLVKFNPNLILLIAGPDDGAKASLEQQVAELGLQHHVGFVGYVDEPTKAVFLRGADLLICPSHSENFGISVLEALSVGCPVVASRGTPWQCLEPYCAGYWVENTPQIFAAAINDVLGRSGQWTSGAKALAACYDVSIQAQMFEKIYRDLCLTQSSEHAAVTRGTAFGSFVRRLAGRLSILAQPKQQRFVRPAVTWRPS